VADANITLIRLTYDSYARRDLAAMLKLLSPEVEMRGTEDLPWGGTYVGHDGAREYFRRLNELTDANPVPEELFGAGEDVVALGRLHGTIRASGHPFDVRMVHIWTVRHGQIVRFAAYIDAPAMLAALAR